MAHAPFLREKARQLRREKILTIDELAERLALSRSTIFYWVRDIEIDRKPPTTWPASAQRKGSRAMQARFRRLRDAAYDQGIVEYPTLIAEPSFRDFVCLYMAEGYKRCRNTVSIGNSDPAIMKLAHSWMRRLSANPLTFWLQYHADQIPTDLRAFWGHELDIAPDSVRLQRKSNSNHLSGRTWRSQHGVLSITARDTYFRAGLEAWMDCLRGEWG